MARFGEEFKEYALLLTNAAGDAVAQPRLIENKIAFLKHYPTVSHDRARAFNYKVTPCAPDNDPGIKTRITLLLGSEDLAFAWTVGTPVAGQYPVSYVLADGNGKQWLEGAVTVTASDVPGAEEAAYRALVTRMILTDAYVIAGTGPYTLTLTDASASEIGHAPQSFAQKSDAEAVRDALAAWSALDRMIVVEHLLLRPKFIGDALYPACCDGGCCVCKVEDPYTFGTENPYSFRLTYVMPGWTDEFTDNLDLRRFANRTIEQETPSHLLAKTCWVGNDGFVENLCDEVIDQLGDLLIKSGLTSGSTPPTPEDACTCANAIYHAFSVSFTAWYADKKFAFLHADALADIDRRAIPDRADLLRRRLHDGVQCRAVGQDSRDHDGLFRRHRAQGLAVRALRRGVVPMARRQCRDRLDRRAPCRARRGHPHGQCPDRIRYAGPALRLCQHHRHGIWRSVLHLDAIQHRRGQQFREPDALRRTCGRAVPGHDFQQRHRCRHRCAVEGALHGLPQAVLLACGPSSRCWRACATPIRARRCTIATTAATRTRSDSIARLWATTRGTPPSNRRSTGIAMEILLDHFPVFEANQVLTSGHLNDVFDYLDQQERQTRSHLIGIGIVCGLEIKLTGSTIALSKGCGVTSEGYLIVEPDDLSLVSYRTYTLPPDLDYPQFKDGTNQYNLWELFEAGTPNTTLLSSPANFLDDKEVVLFLELKKEGLRNCSPNNCDDKGSQVTATVRRLLIAKSDIDKIIAAANGLGSGLTSSDIDALLSARLNLPDLKLRRFDVTSTNPVTSNDVYTAFLNMVRTGGLAHRDGQCADGGVRRPSSLCWWRIMRAIRSQTSLRPTASSTPRRPT